MAYTSPKTYVTGDVLTASELNTYQRDQFLHLAGTDGVVNLSSVAKKISHDALIVQTLGL